MSNTPIIQLQDITYSYPDGTHALHEVTIDVHRGEKVVLLGGNGAGKSTLFLLLNGIIRPSKGQYLFDNSEIKWKRTELSHLRSKVGIVFQEPDNQLFAASVFEEISFGLMNMKLPLAEVKHRVAEAMEWLDITTLQNRPPHLLSYGQKKRVTIASVLAMNPDVLIFDEPISGLDPFHSEHIVGLLEELNAKGKTILLSTHDVNFAYSWAHRVVVMKNGRVEQTGTPSEIFTNDILLDSCGLNVPTVVQVYKHLHITNNKLLPRNLIELLNFIDKEE